MFASKITKDVTVKGDEGQDVAVTLRKLSGKALDAAATAKSASVATVARSMGPEVLQAYKRRDDAPVIEPTEEVLSEARFNAYDRQTVLLAGVVKWDAPVSVEAGVPDLDEDTAEFLYREIVEMSVPTKAQKDAARSKG